MRHEAGDADGGVGLLRSRARERDVRQAVASVPMVDEVAAAALDVWASEHGYTKIELNLVGV